MAIHTIELRNINCAHVKSIEKTLDEYQVSYQRRNYVKNSDILGELTVIFEIFDDAKSQLVKTISNIIKAIMAELAPTQYVSINKDQIKNIGDLKNYLA